MAGTTNLLQWNPTGSNQEDDAAYLADSDSERLSAKDLEALRAIARKIGEAEDREGQQ